MEEGHEEIHWHGAPPVLGDKTVAVITPLKTGEGFQSKSENKGTTKKQQKPLGIKMKMLGSKQWGFINMWWNILSKYTV